MGKHYDFLHSLVGTVKDTQKAIPKKLSQLEKDVELGAKDYDALDNTPIKNVSSSSDSMVYLRDLESGVYRLSGYFHPFEGSGISCSFSSNQLVNVVKKTAGSHIQIFYPVNNVVQFVTIMADETADGGYTYERNDIRLNDLKELISVVGSLDGLTTTDKTSIVAAINETASRGISVSGAEVGQTIEVAAVDENGKPTAWEAVDFPEQVQSDLF